MSRKTFLNASRTNKERLIKAYRVHKSIRATAKALGISRETARKSLEELGIKLLPPGGEYQKYKSKEKTKFSKFERWIEENAGIVLPRSVVDIQKLTGISANTIYCYLYRLRKNKKEQIKSLPDLRTSPILLEDDYNRVVWTADILSYELGLDKYTVELVISAKLVNGEHTTFTIKDIDGLLEKFSA